MSPKYLGSRVYQSTRDVRLIVDESYHVGASKLPTLSITTPIDANPQLRDGNTRNVKLRVCPHPMRPNLFVTYAWSGHGFQFLPIVGQHVVNILEDRMSDEYMSLWRWRFGAESVKIRTEL